MLKIEINTQLNSGAVANIVGDTPEEVHRALQYLLNIGQLGPVAQQAPVAADPEPPMPPLDMTEADAATERATDPVVVREPEPAPEKPKRTRKPKEEKAAPAAEEAKPEPAKEKAPVQGETVKATAADAAKAVTEVANAKGLAVAKELLAEFGVKRAGELKDEQYGPFVKRAEAILVAEENEDDEESEGGLI